MGSHGVPEKDQGGGAWDTWPRARRIRPKKSHPVHHLNSTRKWTQTCGGDFHPREPAAGNWQYVRGKAAWPLKSERSAKQGRATVSSVCKSWCGMVSNQGEPARSSLRGHCYYGGCLTACSDLRHMPGRVPRGTDAEERHRFHELLFWNFQCQVWDDKDPLPASESQVGCAATAQKSGDSVTFVCSPAWVSCSRS